MSRGIPGLVVGLMLSAGVANAQITTYIAPPSPPKPTAAMVASADSARKDSVATAAMTNMKVWVDSAAGVAVPSTVGTIDSAALVNDPGRPVATTFSDGTVAPATASELPTLLVVGALFVLVGTALLSKRARS
jgi:hypothetical protein